MGSVQTRILIYTIALLALLGVGYVIGTRGNDTAPVTQDTSLTPVSETRQSTLDLTAQQLTTLPESALKRTDITTLDLSNNQLSELPKTIANFQQLEVLIVENNRLLTVAAEISELKALRQLRLNNNRLSNLPDSIAAMKQLEKLDISGNDIPLSDVEQLKAALPTTEIIY